MYTCIYIHVHIYIYTCIYIYICLYIYTHTCKVVERVHSLIARLEAVHQDTAIAFFSHADTVQILQVKNPKKSI